MQHDDHADATPIACDLGVFDADERARHESNAQAVLASAHAVAERADGYAFSLSGDRATLQRVGAFVAQESRCCPFFRFDVTVRPGDAGAWLVLTGSPEVKAYMRSELLGHLQRWRPDLVPDRATTSAGASGEAAGASGQP